MNENSVQLIGQELLRAGRIAVISHIRPDGDAVGSVLGLGLALKNAGKQVQMILADGVPVSYRHLPGAGEVQHRIDGEVDLIITLDCSDLQRVGAVLPPDTLPDINIDHHVTNAEFGRINLVDTSAVATAAILAQMLPRWSLPMSQPVAEALLTGLITDTLGFRTSNMTARALRIAADLVDLGVDLPDLYARVLVGRSYEAARFWGVGLSKLQKDGPIVWTTLTREDRKIAGYPGKDDADLINVLASIQECAVALIFVEQPDGRVKVSWRALPGLDVSQIALQFGGGGHPAAAGAEIDGELSSVVGEVLNATRTLFAEPEGTRLRDPAAEGP